jgi:hypothetical protein
VLTSTQTALQPTRYARIGTGLEAAAQVAQVIELGRIGILSFGGPVSNPVPTTNRFSMAFLQPSISSLGRSLLSTWYNLALMANLADIVQQLRDERDRLEAAIAALTSISVNSEMGRTTRPGGRRRFTAAAIAKMRAAQRARRARESAGKKAIPKTSARRRHISPEGLARIRAGQRKRWARVRAGKK